MNMMKLGQAGVEVRDCEHKTPLATEVGHPYIAIPDIVDGRVSLENARRISENDYVEWTKRTTPRVGDIVVTRRGRVGDTAPIPVEGCAVGQNLVILRSDETVILQKYLRWACRSPQWGRGVADFLNVGAVFSSLNVRDIPKISVPVPSEVAQAKIAELLDALDDKIAANEKTCSSLRDLQKSIWSRESRSLPRRPLIELAPPKLGGTPARSNPELWGGGAPWASVRDMTGAKFGVILSTAETITVNAAQPERLSPVPAGSVFLTARGTVGKVAVAGVDCACNQSAYAFVPQPGKNAALRLAIEGAVASLISRAHGSVFSTITTSTLADAEVPDIYNASASRATNELEVLEQRVVAGLKENVALTRTRDEILPLLMNGRITVKDAEGAVGDVV